MSEDITLIHDEYYWIMFGGILQVARYDRDGWSKPTWDLVGTDELTYEYEIDRVVKHVERPE